MSINSGLKIIVLLVLILLAVAVSGQAIKQPPPVLDQESPKPFVGMSACADSPCFLTVVLKVDTPANVAQQIRDAVSKALTYSARVETLGQKQVSVQFDVVSKVVRDQEGKWVFHVYAKKGDLERVLSGFQQYVEQVLVKPKPETLPKMPEGADRGVAPTNFIIRDLIGVSQVENTYGVTGAGVRIAVVDTGVDYGHPDLAPTLDYWSGKYLGIDVREPLVFDADEAQVITFQDVYKVNSTHIYVGGRYYTTYIPYAVNINPPCDYYRISSYIASQPEPYKFGLTYMFVPGVGTVVVGVLMFRPPWAPDKYYAVIFDANGNCRFDDEVFGQAWHNYFSSRIIAPDYNRNGYPDISLGVAGGFFIDWWWNFGYPAQIFPGWDPKGRWLSVFYDFHGHGTSAASAAAGRGVVAYNITGFGVVRLTGMAKGAKIVGVKGLWAGNVEAGMLWVAGFDIDPATGSWYYTGSKRAHVISNSWGISDFLYDVAGFGYDFESVFIEGLSTPGFLDPRYPGIVIVQAGGNGGAGYGTITSPGAALSALTVGASTSTHPMYATSLINPAVYWSAGGWTNNEIISWSLRGPVPAGYNKPDVVNVGAFGYTAAPVAMNYTIFGGTSYATPLTAGVVALVLQVLGPDADPALVKSVVMSSASFISGYNPALQGAGRVDAYKAVSLARLLKGQTAARYEVLASSSSAYQSMSSKLSNMWYWQWCDNIAAHMLWWVGAQLNLTSCALPSAWSGRFAPSVFVADIPKGGSKSFTLVVRNPTNKTISVSVASVFFYAPVVTQNYTLYLSLSPYTSFNRTYIVITPANVTAPSGLLEAVAVMPYDRMDGNNNYQLDLRNRVWIYLWLADKNNNGKPDPDELALVNYGYNYYDYNIATMYLPSARLSGKLGIVVAVDLVRGWDIPSSAYVPPVPITLELRYYRAVPDSRVSISPASVNIPPGGYATLTGTIRSTVNDAPTYYGGFIHLRANTTSGSLYVPYSYTVYTTVDTSSVEVSRGLSSYINASSIGGDNDWAWRYESGDWRVYYIMPASSDIWAFEVQAWWSDLRTSLAVYTLGPDGQWAGPFFGAGASYHKYWGSGVFPWVGTAVGAMDEYQDTRIVTIPYTNYRLYSYPTSKPNTGVYTVVVRTLEYGGSYGAAEPISVKVRGLKAASLLPASSVGSVSGYVRFSLPYIVNSIWAYAGRSWLPHLDVDQHYAPGWSSISPGSMYGPFPAGTLFTFNFNAYNNGAPGQKIDFSSLFRVTIPSLTTYWRYYGQYYPVTNAYWLEDWVRVVK